VKLHFRLIGADEVEKEVTQRDQFNTDEVELIEALIREAHQNSLDAKDPANHGTVRTRLAFHSATPEQRKFFDLLFRDLPPHLEACDLDVAGLELDAPRLLVIEDFGTTGLSGAWDRKDDLPFSDFWRRIGKSHKGGQQGGRWGLGKLVFSGASRARSFFGLTVRSEDPDRAPLLMGQAVLGTHHDSEGRDLDAHGFFSERRPDGFQLPVKDPVYVRNFARATGITRADEPGLSIAIPFVRSDLSADALVRELVRNYYFPILTNQLESEVDGVRIDAASFDELATRYGGPQLRDGRLVHFIRELHAALGDGKPDVTLPEGGIRSLATAFSEAELTGLRQKYGRHELIHVRVPVTLRRKGAMEPAATFFDLFLRRTDGEGQALVVRGAITLPLEAREFRASRTFGALIARDAKITEFLGDAENPSHTRWNANATKLTDRWVNPSARLREIRGSLTSLADLMMQAVEAVEQDALVDIFSVPAEKGAPQPKPKPTPVPQPFPDIPQRKTKFVIHDRQGGFVVRRGPALSAEDLPLRISVAAAYDLIRGNPFRKHNPLDFSFLQPGELRIESSEASADPVTANSLSITATGEGFEVVVSGFDPNRDIVVRAAVQP